MHHIMPGTVEFMIELRGELETLRKLPNPPAKAIAVIEGYIKQFDSLTQTVSFSINSPKCYA